MNLLLVLFACGPAAVELAGTPATLAAGAPSDSPGAPSDAADAPSDMGGPALAEPTPAAEAADPPDAVVDCAGGADFATIGDAIAAAESGDVIHVRPCTYREAIDFAGKQLRIVSTDGPAATIVVGNSGGAVVRAANGEGTGTTLSGFTVQGGGNGSEAAIHVDFASLRLEDVVITGNRGWVTLYGTSADVVLDGVTMTDNRVTYGVHVYMSRGALVATDLALACDAGNTGVYLGHGSGMIDRSTLACGSGYATDWEHAVGHVQRSVVEGSVVVVSEDDHYDDYVNVTNTVVEGTVYANYGSLTLRNSVVTDGITLVDVHSATRVEGSVVTGAACGITANTADFTVRNNVFWDNVADVCGGLPEPVGADGNQAGDPMFVDAAGGDWTLLPGSPAIDAGPEDDAYDDVDGSRNDVGVYGGPYSIGGGW